jgi:hypothetical protein
VYVTFQILLLNANFYCYRRCISSTRGRFFASGRIVLLQRKSYTSSRVSTTKATPQPPMICSFHLQHSSPSAQHIKSFAKCTSRSLNPSTQSKSPSSAYTSLPTNTAQYYQVSSPVKQHKHATKPIRRRNRVLQNPHARSSIPLQRTAKLSSRSPAWYSIAVSWPLAPGTITIWPKRLPWRKRSELWMECNGKVVRAWTTPEIDGRSRGVMEFDELYVFAGFIWTVESNCDTSWCNDMKLPQLMFPQSFKLVPIIGVYSCGVVC